jgi:hypothetical protein
LKEIKRIEMKRAFDAKKLLWRLDRSAPQDKEYKLFRSKRRVR